MIEVHHLAALPAETKLYFAIKAFDSDGNAGPLSNVATLTTPGVAPAPVADLAVSGATKTVAVAVVHRHRRRRHGRTRDRLRAALREDADRRRDLGQRGDRADAAPQDPGTRETVTVAGLDPTSVYYFAIKVIDDVGNTSPMSNLASGSTLDGTAPARVTDLVAAPVDPTQRPALALTVTRFQRLVLAGDRRRQPARRERGDGLDQPGVGDRAADERDVRSRWRAQARAAAPARRRRLRRSVPARLQARGAGDRGRQPGRPWSPRPASPARATGKSGCSARCPRSRRA